MQVSREMILAALEQAGLDEEAVYDGYSGRCMYGATCFGIVAQPHDFALFCAAVGASSDDWEYWINDLREDQLGLSMIWYWPGHTLDKSEAKA